MSEITTASPVTKYRDLLNELYLPGMLQPYAGASAPTGWLLADGSAINRTTYARLFAVIGTTYGAGNGTTTFNLPDLRGRVAMGVDGAAGRVSTWDALGESAGAEKHTLAASELAAHSHRYSSPVPTAEMPLAPNYVGTVEVSSGSGHTVPEMNHGDALFDGGSGAGTSQTGTQPATTGDPHNNMQPYLTVNWLVKT